MEGTSYSYLAHLVTLPVRVGDVEARFALDTGIGPTLLGEALAHQVGCAPNGETFTGRRMSGQEVSVPLADAPPIRIGALTREGHVVGVLDTSGFPAPLDTLDGFLSLAFFEETAFTVDYPRGVVVVESPSTLAERAARGTSVPVRLDRQGACARRVPAAHGGRARLDRGRGGHGERRADPGRRTRPLAGHRARRPGGASHRRRDETGNAYVRRFTHLDETIHVTGAPSLAQTGTDVMFQEIIYDGLIGDAFLRRFVVTYDQPAERMIFARAN